MLRKEKTTRVYARTRNGTTRYYGDFRSLGGGQEALKPPGHREATTDLDTAQELAAKRAKEIRAGRQRKFTDTPTRTPRLGEYAEYHLEEKMKSRAVTEEHVAANETYLGRAVDFLGSNRDLSTVSVAEIGAFCNHLRTIPSKNGGNLEEGTIRKHLNGLSNLYRRAQGEGFVVPGFNPVSLLMDKPTDSKKEAAWLEIDEAAKYLVGARIYSLDLHLKATPLIHYIVATFLLTGGRKSEVLGLTNGDVNFERRIITFRNNKHRRLKTNSSERSVPLWPQLEEILTGYRPMIADTDPSALFFPSQKTGRMIRDLRKALDTIAVESGWKKGEIRTKIFRHTYCAARLQTLDNGAPVSMYTVTKEMGHEDSDMVQEVYGHLGQIRHRSEHVEYRMNPAEEEAHQLVLSDPKMA